MKKYVLALIWLWLSIQVSANGGSPILIAHRGSVPSYPENSISSFRKALKYTNYLEMDIQFSKDHYPVVFHDRTLDRMTNCTGLVSKKNIVELQKGCRLDNCHSTATTQIPSIKDVLNDPIVKKGFLIIEIKTFDKEGIDRLISSVASRKNILFSSFNIDILRYLKNKNRYRKLFWVSYSLPKKIPSFIEGLLLYSKAATNLIRSHTRKNLTIFVWTVDTKKEFNRCKSLPIDGIVTNLVQRFGSYRSHNK